MIALLSAIYTLVSVASFLVYKKVSIAENTWLFIGVIFIALGFIMVIYPSPPILILSNILTTIGMFFFSVIWNAQLFHLISDYSPVQKARFLIWREWLLVISRCVMLVIILNLTSFQGTTYILLISIALICLLLIPIFQKKALSGLENY